MWIPWSELVPEYEHDPNINYNEILVPTVETTRASWLINHANKTRRPVMIIGEAGCSKTAIMQNNLRGLDPNIFVLFAGLITCFTLKRLYSGNVYRFKRF